MFGQKRTNPREGIETLNRDHVTRRNQCRVRKERIPVRGLKPTNRFHLNHTHRISQKRTNPREGIETISPGMMVFEPLVQGQKRTNPREGIETRYLFERASGNESAESEKNESP